MDIVDGACPSCGNDYDDLILDMRKCANWADRGDHTSGWRIDDWADQILRLRSDNERMREALLLKVQQDNACRGRFGGWMRSSRPIDAPPCGPQGGKWDSQQCGCALEARSALSKGQGEGK